MKTRTALILMFAALALFGGCPQQKAAEQNGTEQAKGQTSQALTPDELTQTNLFNIKGMDGVTPFSLDMNRQGDTLFSQFKIKGQPGLNTACFSLKDGVLKFSTGLAKLPDVTRPFVGASPSEEKCLTIGKDKSRLVYYETVQGLPKDRPFDDFYNLSPFFSWDGKAVIVPLKYSGVVINNLDPQGYVFVKYPDFIEKATGMRLHALPNQNGKRRIFASIWQAGLYEDECHLYTLDLDNPEWKEITTLKWIVYEAGGPDLDNEPWLIAGSRGKEDATETKRTPIYGMLDPASGVTELLRSFGEPVWQIEVEPYGKYVLFLDEQRQALVRLDPLTGDLDYDPRWFNKDAKIITSTGSKTVLLWYRSMLLQAKWSGHEKQEGLQD
jgi:hypothetical protein